jgi:branched-chain amino acid transport system ATP-binding protein
MLNVEKLEGGYKDFKVLHGVNFSVKAESITALLGSNGAGKTTTVNTIIGLLKSWSGKIEFNGINITNQRPDKIAKLGIGLVPEGRRIFGNMTVYENLELGAYIKDARKKFKDTIEWIYTLFPILKERKNQRAETLSGGEQQMLAIARALMHKPKLLMLDEPSNGLAPKITQQIFNIIEKLRDEGITILLVEQNAHLTFKIMDYGFILERGIIIGEGTAKELIENTTIKKAYIGL